MFPPAVGRPLTWIDAPYATALVVLIALAGIGTAILFLVGLTAYRRRRTRTYLLVSVALGLLVIRSIVGAGTVYGAVPMLVHHFVGHAVDFLVALLLLGAIYVQRLDGVE